MNDINKILAGLSEMELSSLLQNLTDTFVDKGDSRDDQSQVIDSPLDSETKSETTSSNSELLQDTTSEEQDFDNKVEDLNNPPNSDPIINDAESPIPDELNHIPSIESKDAILPDASDKEQSVDTNHLSAELVDMQSQIYEAVSKRLVHDIFIIGGKSLTLDASISDLSDLWFSNVYIAKSLSLNTVTEFLDFNELGKLEDIVTANVWSRQSWPINQCHLNHLINDFDPKSLYDWGFDELNEVADELGHEQLNILNVIDELCDLASPTIALQAFNGSDLMTSDDLKINPNLASILTIMMHLNALKAGSRLMIEKLTDNKVTYQQSKAYVPNFVAAYLFFTYYRTKKISQGHLLYLSRLVSMLFSMIVNRHVIVEIK